MGCLGFVVAVQLARDLVLVVDDVPEAGQSRPVRERREWGTGELLLPLARTPVVDTTGAGDAFTAPLIAGLGQLQDPEEAARLAVAAAGLTVGHPGGRPELSWARLKEQLARVNARRPDSLPARLSAVPPLPGHRGLAGDGRLVSAGRAFPAVSPPRFAGLVLAWGAQGVSGRLGWLGKGAEPGIGAPASQKFLRVREHPEHGDRGEQRDAGGRG
jgi:pfkB family carbohydrate kinase